MRVELKGVHAVRIRLKTGEVTYYERLAQRPAAQGQAGFAGVPGELPSRASRAPPAERRDPSRCDHRLQGRTAWARSRPIIDRYLKRTDKQAVAAIAKLERGRA